MVPIITAQRFSLHRFQPLEQQTEPGHMRVRLKAVRFIREGYLAPTVADTLGNTDERVHRSVAHGYQGTTRRLNSRPKPGHASLKIPSEIVD